MGDHSLKARIAQGVGQFVQGRIVGMDLWHGVRFLGLFLVS